MLLMVDEAGVKRRELNTEDRRAAPARGHFSYILISVSVCPIVRWYSRFHWPWGRWHRAILFASEFCPRMAEGKTEHF